MFSPRCLRHWGKQQNSGTILNWFLCDAFLGSQKDGTNVYLLERVYLILTSVPPNSFCLKSASGRNWCPDLTVSSGKLASNVGRRNKRKCPTPDQNSKVETGNENRKKRCWKMTSLKVSQDVVLLWKQTIYVSKLTTSFLNWASMTFSVKGQKKVVKKTLVKVWYEN